MNNWVGFKPLVGDSLQQTEVSNNLELNEH